MQKPSAPQTAPRTPLPTLDRPLKLWTLLDYFRQSWKNMPASRMQGAERVALWTGLVVLLLSVVPLVLLVFNVGGRDSTVEPTVQEARLLLLMVVGALAVFMVGFLVATTYTSKSATLRRVRELKAGAPCRTCGNVLTMQQREHAEHYANPARIVRTRAEWLKEYNGRVVGPSNKKGQNDMEAAGRL